MLYQLSYASSLETAALPDVRDNYLRYHNGNSARKQGRPTIYASRTASRGTSLTDGPYWFSNRLSVASAIISSLTAFHAN